MKQSIFEKMKTKFKSSFLLDAREKKNKYFTLQNFGCTHVRNVSSRSWLELLLIIATSCTG